MTTTSVEPTTTPGIPRPDEGGEPAWCTFRGLEHEWDQDFDGTWTRTHEHAVGWFSVAQVERFTTDGRTFDAPSGNTSLATFDSAKDARALASDLAQIARIFEQIEWAASSDIAAKLAKVVSAAIRDAGLSRQDIAEATDIARSTLSRRLTGHSPFLITELADIARVLGVNPGSLLRWLA